MQKKHTHLTTSAGIEILRRSLASHNLFPSFIYTIHEIGSYRLWSLRTSFAFRALRPPMSRNQPLPTQSLLPIFRPIDAAPPPPVPFE